MQPTTFFNKTYNEALTLLLEARTYIAENKSNNQGQHVMNRLIYCRETMRLTTRMTYIMAWLLNQKAVHAGEISWDQAVISSESLSEQTICLEESNFDDTQNLDQELLELLDRSQKMYVRVTRLDDLMRRNVGVA